MRQYGLVFVATNGRGVVYHDITAVVRSSVEKVANVGGLRLARIGKTLSVSGAHSLKLFNTRGVLVRSGASDGGRTIVDLSGLSRGLYIARWEGKARTVIVHQ
jgi:hypothetical protein